MDEDSIIALTDTCNGIYETRWISGELRHSVFTKIPKKKKALWCGEHRTISCLCQVINLILRMIERNNNFEREREKERWLRHI